jgi:hypothetical protein
MTYEDWFIELCDYLTELGYDLDWFDISTVLDLEMLYEINATFYEIEEYLLDWFNE